MPAAKSDEIRTDFQSIILNLQRYWHTMGQLFFNPMIWRWVLVRFIPPQPCVHLVLTMFGARLMCSHHGVLLMAVMEKTLIGCSIIISFQVILKPSPKESQALYLGSLKAIGLNPDLHDIRFVEDDWESPTLGAWGLGWEVWCDGMEVSQFTYFQQVGGIECNPIPLELTYGLERLAMYIQGIENVYDLDWDGVPESEGGKNYGDIFKRAEVEFSRWNYEEAETKMLFGHFQMLRLNVVVCLLSIHHWHCPPMTNV